MPMQRFQPYPEAGQQSFPGKGGKGGKGGKNHFPSYYPPAGPPPLPSPYAYRSTPVQPPPPPPPPPPPAVSGKGKGGRATEVVGTVEITGRHRIGKKTSARRVEEVGDWRCIIEDGKPQWFENIITNEVQTNPPRGFWQQLRGTKKEGKVDPFKGQRGDVQVGDRIWQFCQKFKFGSDIEEELRIHTTYTMRKILDNEYLTESELLADLAKYTPDPDPSTRASRETVLDFIWRHKLDDYAANEFLNLHQEGIDEILAGGDLTAFRNPSAKMTNLTRTAKEELQRKNRLKRAGGMTTTPQNHGSRVSLGEAMGMAKKLLAEQTILPRGMERVGSAEAARALAQQVLLHTHGRLEVPYEMHRAPESLPAWDNNMRNFDSALVGVPGTQMTRVEEPAFASPLRDKYAPWLGLESEEESVPPTPPAVGYSHVESPRRCVMEELRSDVRKCLEVIRSTAAQRAAETVVQQVEGPTGGVEAPAPARATTDTSDDDDMYSCISEGDVPSANPDASTSDVPTLQTAHSGVQVSDERVAELLKRQERVERDSMEKSRKLTELERLVVKQAAAMSLLEQRNAPPQAPQQPPPRPPVLYEKSYCYTKAREPSRGSSQGSIQRKIATPTPVHTLTPPTGVYYTPTGRAYTYDSLTQKSTWVTPVKLPQADAPKAQTTPQTIQLNIIVK